MMAGDGAELYLVKSGDTLTKIAAVSGKAVKDLMRWNGLSNPDRLAAGQTLYLSERSAFGVSVLFLDALRSPIENLPYRIRFDGKSETGTTPSNGLGVQVVTRDAKSTVDVLVRDLEGNWRVVCQTASDYGHKLLTLVSGAIVIKGDTEKHPSAASTKPTVADRPSPTSKGTVQPGSPPQATGLPSKNNPAVKTKKAKAKQGQSIIQVAVEIPQGVLDLFAKYEGGDITEVQWKEVADGIGCEPEVLKAIAQVESGGRNAFWRLNSVGGANVPALLYERHYFSKETGGAYDKEHPDISWPTGYRKKSRLGEKDKKMSDGKIDADDVYGDYSSAYLRFINAYRLDANAALKSCSWGKFQIMGANFGLCGALNVKIFVEKMCTSDATQIGLLAEFIRNKPQSWKDAKNKKLGKEISLHEAVKTKNWAAIAFNYNGPGYKTYDYDTKLKAAYDRTKKSA